FALADISPLVGNQSKFTANTLITIAAKKYVGSEIPYIAAEILYLTGMHCTLRIRVFLIKWNSIRKFT
ncbi:MAG: hypothetical protein II367_00375, partial [Treponema sp.]|nr:hypothetical protein [Treponema sp.]